MITKLCTKCRQKKPVDQSNVKNRRTQQRHSYCKVCMYQCQKDYYAKNPKAQIRRSLRWRKQQVKWVTRLKIGKPCMDCQHMFPPCCMDFDHRPGVEKCFSVAEGAQRASRASILAEIEKCDLVCANCHRIRTFNRLQGVDSDTLIS